MTSAQEVGGTENIILNDAEAFAGIVLVAVASDRQISQPELKRMYFLLARMRLFQGWSETQYHAIIDKFWDMLKSQGLEPSLDLCIRSLSPKLYQTAFAIAVDLVLTDGTVTQEEKDFLYDLQKKLGLETKLATKIIEVIMIKNRG